MPRLIPLLATSLTLWGCKPMEGPTGTLGEKGRVGFEYRQGCFFGCPIEQPLLAGSRQTIDVSDPGDDEGATVRSSNDEIAEFAIERECFCERDEDDDNRIPIALDASCSAPRKKRCHNRVLVQANAEGDVRLELLDANERAIDRVTVFVREPVAAVFEADFDNVLGAVAAKEFELAPEQRVQFHLTLHDDEGRELLASDGVRWIVSDPAVVTLSGFLIPEADQVDDGLEVTAQGVSAGEAELRIEVVGFEDSVTLTVAE